MQLVKSIAYLPILAISTSLMMPAHAATPTQLMLSGNPIIVGPPSHSTAGKAGKSCSIRAKHRCQTDKSTNKTDILSLPSASPQPTLTCRQPTPNSPVKCH
jgi:hypothetical protein